MKSRLPAQPLGNWFSKLGAFEHVVKWYPKSALFAARTGGRPKRIPMKSVATRGGIFSFAATSVIDNSGRKAFAPLYGQWAN